MNGLQAVLVSGESVRPIVFAHKKSGLLIISYIPRETVVKNVGVVNLAETEVLRLTECLVKALGDPGIVFINALSDYDRVHLRKESCLTKIIHLDSLVVGKEPADLWRATKKAGRHTR